MLRSLVARSQRHTLLLVAVLIGAISFLLARGLQPTAPAGERFALAANDATGVCDERERSSGPNKLLFVSCAGFLP